jgi:ribonuclease HII
MILCGVDEVGRGSLAGPVISVAYCCNDNTNLSIAKDSKTISPKRRLILADFFKQNSIEWSFGIVSSFVIDKINIHQASLLSMQIALKNLASNPDMVYVDGKFTPETVFKVQSVVKGDSIVPVISVASIIAKVFRDNIMVNYAKVFSDYLFEKNFGYGTKYHIDSLKMNGLTRIHRKTFKPCNMIFTPDSCSN